MIVERLELVLAHLPEDFEGLRVAVLSDLHAGAPRQGSRHVLQAVELTQSLEPELILLLGDTFDRPAHASEYLGFLRGLSAPLGVWTCLGNHEHGIVWYTRLLRRPWPGSSIAEWKERFGQLGIGVLVNEAVCVEKKGARLWLAGVDDAYSGQDDLAATLEGIGPNECVVGMTHSPDVVDDPLSARLDLLLAGHTHGGQIHFPFLGPLWAPCRRPRQRCSGLKQANGTRLYVTRGTGDSFPLRMACPRELTLLLLKGGSAQDTDCGGKDVLGGEGQTRKERSAPEKTEPRARTGKAN